MAGFGTNEWLVEEMYQQYLADPSSVDQAWHEFFADYRPGSPVAASDDREQAAAPAAAPAQAQSPAPAPAQSQASTPSPAPAAPSGPGRARARQRGRAGERRHVRHVTHDQPGSRGEA